MTLLRTVALYYFSFLIPIFGFSFGSEKIFEKFPNKYFIESGTCQGKGVKQALSTRCFSEIHSIELSKAFYMKAVQRFKLVPNVKLWQGDSGVILNQVLQNIDAPATFWLDAHYSGGSTAKGSSYSPILRELDCIKKHHIKNHVILIDDVRQFGTVDFDFVTLDQIVSKILEINPRYTIEFVDCPYKEKDVLVARVKP